MIIKLNYIRKVYDRRILDDLLNSVAAAKSITNYFNYKIVIGILPDTFSGPNIEIGYCPFNWLHVLGDGFEIKKILNRIQNTPGTERKLQGRSRHIQEYALAIEIHWNRL